MKTELSHRLAEQWRDALSAYAIHHVLPDKLQAGSLGMMTADHLDRYPARCVDGMETGEHSAGHDSVADVSGVVRWSVACDLVVLHRTDKGPR